MVSPYLEYPQLVDLATDGGFVQNPALTQLSAVFLLSACVYMQSRWLWQNPIAPISDNEYEAILSMIEQAESELMTSINIGQIIPAITILDSDIYIILAGQTLTQADYPKLYDVVPLAWISGTDIILPDMNQRSLHGENGANVGDIVGENNVTLDVSQIPSHNHTQNPHSHTEVIPAVTPTGAGPIVAGASVVIPTPSTTGFATASNNATGGDGAHNNVPESLAVYWHIVAR